MLGTLTAAEIVTVISAIGVLIAAIGSVTVNVIMALRTGVKVEQTTAAVAELSAKTDVVAGHVNSAATKSAEQIVALQAQLTSMAAQLAEKKETAALLVQSLGQAAAAKPGVAALIPDRRRGDAAAPPDENKPGGTP